MSYGEQYEYGYVPQTVGYDVRHQIAAIHVQQSPEESADQGCHDEHEIERPHVYQRIDKCGGDVGDIFAVAFREVALYVATPEYLFRRTDKADQYKGDE